MTDYYKILNVSLQKKKGTITDEMVEKNYEAKRQQFLKMQKAEGKMKIFGSDEIGAILENEYLDLLENAYYAIRTENARMHYDELYASIQEYLREKEQAKQNARSEDKEDKKDQTMKEDSFQNILDTINKKNPTTDQLISKIKEEAEKKYPIKKPENIDNEDMER